MIPPADGTGRFAFHGSEELLVFSAFLADLSSLELDEQFLNIFLPLELSLAVPRVKLLPEAELFRVNELLLLELLFNGCLIAIHPLVKVEIEILLLDLFFELGTLLHTQTPEANLS